MNCWPTFSLDTISDVHAMVCSTMRAAAWAFQAAWVACADSTLLALSQQCPGHRFTCAHALGDNAGWDRRQTSTGATAVKDAATLTANGAVPIMN